MDDIRGQLLQISEKLQYLYRGKLSLETVERYVFESYELLDAKSDVKVYLLPLAERFSRDRLNALMKSQDPSSSGTVDVLFVCVHNSGRSQMAAGFMAKLGGDRVVVR